MIFPKAIWHGPVPNRYPWGMQRPVMGLVLHVMQSGPNEGVGAVNGIEGCDAWFHNPASQVSAHFGTGIDGELYQWVDTADAAWAEVSGNSHWISIENSGDSGEALLPTQIESCAEVLAWLHTSYGVPLALSENPNQAGLGYHAMGGAAWGNHLQCPGPPIVAQRQTILARAAQLVAPAVNPAPWGKCSIILDILQQENPPIFRETLVAAQQRLKALGYYTAEVDGCFTPAMSMAVKAYQAHLGIAQDGVLRETEYQHLYS